MLLNPSEIIKLLKPGQCISKKLTGFEIRPQQTQMIEYIIDAINSKKHIMIEAGTGTGKTFAYLIPLIKYSISEKQIIVVSTNTINLQEQIIHKDIPFLQKTLPWTFTSAIAKGRKNYVCIRRFFAAIQNVSSLFPSSQEKWLDYLKEWFLKTQDGSLSDLEKKVPIEIWEKICSDSDICLYRKCSYFRKDCFVQKAKQCLYKANIIIANHHLYFTDLAIQEKDASILPPHEVVCFDEAHNLHHTAQEHFAIEISYHKLNYLLNQLLSANKKKGLLTIHRDIKALKLTQTLKGLNKDFFLSIEKYLKDRTKNNILRIKEPNFVPDIITPSLDELVKKINHIKKTLQNIHPSLTAEFKGVEKKLNALLLAITDILLQQYPTYVSWIELSSSSRWNVTLKSAPIDISFAIRNHILAKKHTVIMTSASLTTSSDIEGFRYFKDKYGMTDDSIFKRLTSPFNYKEQMHIYIFSRLPFPESKEHFVERASRSILGSILETKGGTLVLFTSYSLMNSIYENISKELEKNDILVFKQGEKFSRHAIISKFKKTKNAVIFGTDSFWEGIDIPGSALRSLVITKLPFPVPSSPLVEAYAEKLRNEGKNPFHEYFLPEAILKLKQGIGRLIRTKKDKGIISILDKRILVRSYGISFMESLPQCDIKVIE